MRLEHLQIARQLLSKGPFVVALAALIGLGVLVVRQAVVPAPTGAWAGLIVAAGAYLISHLLRIARLALLSGDVRLSLRALAKVHLFTSGVSLVTPFKLGEIYRVLELSLLTQSAVRGVILVWLERVFDVTVILALLLLATVIQPEAVASYAGVLLLSLVFVLATLVLVVLMPDNLRRAGSYIIRRYDQPWTIRVLWLIAELRGMISKMSQMLRGRRASLLVFTVMIWVMEGLSFGLVMSNDGGLLQPISGLLSFLSLTTEGETLATFVQRPAAFPAALVSYVVATQGLLLLLATVAGLSLIRTRILPAHPPKT